MNDNPALLITVETIELNSLTNGMINLFITIFDLVTCSYRRRIYGFLSECSSKLIYAEFYTFWRRSMRIVCMWLEFVLNASAFLVDRILIYMEAINQRRKKKYNTKNLQMVLSFKIY